MLDASSLALWKRGKADCQPEQPRAARASSNWRFFEPRSTRPNHLCAPSTTVAHQDHQDHPKQCLTCSSRFFPWWLFDPYPSWPGILAPDRQTDRQQHLVVSHLQALILPVHPTKNLHNISPARPPPILILNLHQHPRRPAARTHARIRLRPINPLTVME